MIDFIVAINPLSRALRGRVRVGAESAKNPESLLVNQ